ncbi:hypothetical protein [Hyphomicrobium sp.]|uniref:hypothetical protein n=1 Tax=Hyphomicrobium sp. TaxID=82 RepID=UPI001DF38DEF|nr:hypothetical protein [Hyphomicrobium sp.]MBY0559670.1 hypothetical protein [Hyphomicrobium sp.]
MVSTPATRAVVAERRKILTQIAAAEAKLYRLRFRLNLVEVKLVAFDYDIEQLRKARKPERFFKRPILRRIFDLERTFAGRLTANEIAVLLAEQDGLDGSKRLVRSVGTARVRDALKRRKKKGAPF